MFMDNYKLLSIIGEGSHGKVYLARNTHNTLYAVKKCNVVRNITQEDIILADCNHPLIQKMVEKYNIGNYNYLVLDYYKEGDLHEYLCKCHYFCVPEQHVTHLIYDIIAAISYLHSVGVIHRDLKLENIMLHEGKLILCDFNLSHYDKVALRCKIYSGVDVIEPDAILNDFVGTIEYLAPEIVLNEPYGCMIDWWAFGIMVYELLYGYTPFYDEIEEMVLINIKSKRDISYQITPLGALSNQMKKFLIKLLSYDLHDRLGYLGGGVEIFDCVNEFISSE